MKWFVASSARGQLPPATSSPGSPSPLPYHLWPRPRLGRRPTCTAPGSERLWACHLLGDGSQQLPWFTIETSTKSIIILRWRILSCCCRGLGFWRSVYLHVDAHVSEKQSFSIIRGRKWPSPRRWRQHVSPKRRHRPANTHGMIIILSKRGTLVANNQKSGCLIELSPSIYDKIIFNWNKILIYKTQRFSGTCQAVWFRLASRPVVKAALSWHEPFQ
jgi:hypothetical protein